MALPAYTQAQLMVAAAAREINNGDVVFVGMRLPLLGFQLAKSTHAPRNRTRKGRRNTLQPLSR
jgi:glutaconate CoA-transferase subunit B